MAKKIIPSEFKTNLIDQLLESVSEPANTVYYSFIGNHTSTGSTEEEVVQPVGSLRSLKTQAFQNMILAKKLSSNDMKAMISRYDWTENTAYTMFDDRDQQILDKNFFVVVDEAAYKHVYKCLYNNNGANSTIKPLFNDVTYDQNYFEVSDNYYQTADGYVWKYMYSITSTDFAKFSTEKYIPVIANTVNEQNSQDGSIDVIKVDFAGKFYNNYVNGRLTAEDIWIQGERNWFRLPSGSSTVEGFYANTMMHVTTGTCAGEYKKVTNSRLIQGIGVIVELADPEGAGSDEFSVKPDSTTVYEISPLVEIISDGTQTANAHARAIIDSTSSNSVQRIEILTPGLNYSSTTSYDDEVVVNVYGDDTELYTRVLKGTPADRNNESSGTIISPVDAEIRSILGPSGGHGSNPKVELGAKNICIYNRFEKDESGTVPAVNSFGQFGIIKDPLFADIEVDYKKISDSLVAGSDGTFLLNEKIYQFNKIKLHCEVTCNTTSTLVTANENDAEHHGYLKNGDWIYLADGNETESHFLSQVDTVGSNTFNLSSNIAFASSNAHAYLATITGEGTISELTTSSKFHVKDVDRLEVNKIIIGTNSYAVANVSAIDINNRDGTSSAAYDFTAVNQMTKCNNASSVSGTFAQDELVYQGVDFDNATMTAYVHSYDSTNGELFLTKVVGKIVESENIKSNDGDFTMVAPFDKYDGDFDATTGDIIYLQNDIPVTRENNQSEVIRVILEF